MRKIIGLVVLLIAALAGSVSAAEKKPNIVLILADDLGYGDLGTYGGWIPVPHIDQLAKEGLKFTDFHANGNVCSPTRAALMTGRYQQRAGITGVIKADPRALVHNDGLQANEITLPELMKKAGYLTTMYGKWHLGYDVKYNPTLRGFDEFIGYVSGNVDYFSHVDQAGRLDWWHNQQIHDESGYTTHLVTKHALDFLQANAKSDRPFFLYLPFEPPHAPYQAPDSGPRQRVGEVDRNGDGDGGTTSRKPVGPAVKKTYSLMVQELDKGIGQIMDELHSLNLDENTLVIFSSDNGAVPVGSNAPLRGHKGTDWEGGHREPTIFRWTGHIKPGITDQMGISMDIMPTLLELAGTKPPASHKLDGISLLSFLLHGQPIGPRQLFWNGNAMRDGLWSLVRGQRDANQTELFNLANDIGQHDNIASKEPERVKQMLSALEAWKRDVNNGKTPQPSGK